jgi:hypothetical protein
MERFTLIEAELPEIRQQNRQRGLYEKTIVDFCESDMKSAYIGDNVDTRNVSKGLTKYGKKYGIRVFRHSGLVYLSKDN